MESPETQLWPAIVALAIGIFLLRTISIFGLNLINTRLLVEVTGEAVSPDQEYVLTAYETCGLWMGTGGYTVFNLRLAHDGILFQRRSIVTGRWTAEPPGDILKLETTKRDFGVSWSDSRHLRIRVGRDPWANSPETVDYLIKKPSFGDVAVDYVFADAKPGIPESRFLYRPLKLPFDD